MWFKWGTHIGYATHSYPDYPFVEKIDTYWKHYLIAYCKSLIITEVLMRGHAHTSHLYDNHAEVQGTQNKQLGSSYSKAMVLW